MRVRYTLNAPAVVVTLIVLAVLAPAIYCWNIFQVRRAAQAFLSEARTLEDAGRHREAADYLHRYLSIIPADDEARIRIARVYDEGAENPHEKARAVELLYRAIGLSAASDGGANRDLRRRLARQLIELNRPIEAVEQARLAIQGPSDADAIRLLALAMYGRARSEIDTEQQLTQDTATQEFADLLSRRPLGVVVDTALQLSPADVELSAVFAEICAEEPQWLPGELQDEPVRLEKARKTIEAMRTAHPTDPAALMVSFHFNRRRNPQQAERDLSSALQHASDNTQVVLTAAKHRRQQAAEAQAADHAEQARNRREQAAALYRRLVDEHGIVSEAIFQELGEVLLENGSRQEALAAWKEGLRSLGKGALLHVSLADLLISENQLNEAEQQLDQLDAELQRWSSGKGTNISRRVVLAANYQRARLHTERQESVAAIDLLEGILSEPRGRENPTVWHLVGVNYSEVRQWDLAARAFEKANLLSPTAQRQLLTGLAWLRAGNLELAEDSFRESDASSFDGRLAYIESRLRRQALPTAEQPQEVVEQLYRELESLAAKIGSFDPPPVRPWRVFLLQADVAASLGRAERMRQVLGRLREAQQEYASDTDFLTAVIPRLESLGADTDANQALQLLQARGSDAAVLAEANLLRLRGELGRAEQLLSYHLETHPQKSHELRRALTSLLVNQGRYEEALNRLSNAELDLELAQRAAEITLNLSPTRGYATAGEKYRRQLATWSSQVEIWEAKLKELEGPQGTFWRYCRSRRLARLAASPSDPVLAEAEAIHQGLQQRRPDWFPTHFVQGIIAESRGRWDEAAEAYETALRFNAESMAVYERLALAMLRSGRFGEVDKLLERMGRTIAASRGLSAVAMTTAAQLNDLPGAIAVAQRGVENRPTDPTAWIWLGQVSTLAGLKNDSPDPHFQRAEQALRRAVELGEGKDATSWLALFNFLVRIGENDRAHDVLRRMALEATFADMTQRSLALAQACETLEEWQQAELHYLEAQRHQTDGAGASLKLASFYFKRQQLLQAEELLERVLETDADSQPARHLLAVLLASQGGEWGRVEELLGDAEDSTNERLYSVLISGRGRIEDLEKAKGFLQRIMRDPTKVTPADRLLLASINVRLANSILADDERTLERAGLLAEARQQYDHLVYQEQPAASHVAASIEFQLGQKDYVEAERQLAVLQRIEPKSRRTVALRARLLHAQERRAETLTALESWVNGQEPDEAQTQARAWTGRILLSLGIHDEAARVLRKAYEEDSSTYPLLARALASQNDVQRRREAVSLCLSAGADDLKQQVSALASVFVAAPTAPEDAAKCRPVLSRAIEEFGEDPQVLLSAAGAYLVLGDSKTAEKLYRRVLMLRPRDPITLNNLATIVAEHKTRLPEAEQLVDRAIELSGEKPYLLDTKGIVLLASGRASEAAEVLERAAGLDSDPRHLFHFTAALLKAEQRGRAEKMWDRLDRDALARQLLTGNDQQLLQELTRNLDG